MLKVLYHGNLERGSYRSFYYLLSNPTSKKECLTPAGELFSCREFFVGRYRYIITGQPANIPSVKKAYALTMYGYPSQQHFEEWKVNLLEDSQKGSQKGLYITNSFEKAHKWPLTKLYPVECTSLDIPMVYFVGPRKWTMSPYLMSIWTLCIRLGRNKWLPKKLLTLDHENLVRQLAISAGNSPSGDRGQVRATLRNWDDFMSLYHKLFGGVARKDHWALTHLNGKNARPEGILKLINGTTGYKELHNKFIKLTKEPK
jgi:hypothetical protein